MDAARQKILVGFKANDNRVNFVHLQDKSVELVVASWHNVKVTYQKLPASKPPADMRDRWDWIWQGVQINPRELAWLTGLGDFAMVAFTRAQGNHLIYPDGTISSMANILLRFRVGKELGIAENEKPKDEEPESS